jgi:polar amino acid transport system permease protein
MRSVTGERTNVTWLDIVISLALIAAGMYIFYRIREGLHYRWNWDAIPQYLFRYDEVHGRLVPNLLIQGLLTTIRLSVWGTILASIIGCVMGFFRASRSIFRQLLGRTYVELIRNVPPLVLVFILYYFIGDQIITLLGIDRLIGKLPGRTTAILEFFLGPPAQLSPFLSALITIAIFEGAYITEIVRAGIQSIPRGQYEAASALGFSRAQTMRHIVLPQAIKTILPPLAGQFISTIKDSAIVSVISIQELTFQGMELMSATYLTFECWITITVLYLILTLTLSLGAHRLELYIRRNEA